MGKKLIWLWLLFIIAILAGASYFVYVKYLKTGGEETTSEKTDEETPIIIEDWQIEPSIFRENLTSTDTHKIVDNLYRIYFMENRGISFAESTDGITFGSSQPTGVKEEDGKMISNPAVLEISTVKWIMIYEMAPIRKPDQPDKTPPGPSTQRNLYLATSTDGKSFKATGIAIDSAKDDRYFASVPDLIKTPDGKIRMYYVSQGDAIGLAISIDEGKTWTREVGFRLKDMAVDPDVLYKDGKWIMYYSILDPVKNALYKATSTDGLNWVNQTKLFSSTTNGVVVDPDVFETSANNYVMFFGQSVSGGSTGGEQINLYRATYSGEIHDK